MTSTAAAATSNRERAINSSSVSSCLLTIHFWFYAASVNDGCTALTRDWRSAHLGSLYADPRINPFMTAAPPSCSNAHAADFSSRTWSLSLHGTCLIESLFIAAADLYLHTDVNHLKTLAFPIENGSHFISENTGAEGLQLIWNMQHLRIKRNIVLHDENLKFLRYCHETD